MKDKYSLEGLVLSLISLFFIRESILLNRGKEWIMSPGLFPLIVSSLSFIFSTILIFTDAKEKIGRDRKDLELVLSIIALSLIYYALLEKIGFIISSIFYLASFMLILKERNLKILAGISIIIPVFLFFVFSNLLAVQLP